MTRSMFWAIVSNGAAAGVNIGAVITALVLGNGARAVFHIMISSVCIWILKTYYDRALPNPD